jgi:hypothetical protein
VGQKLVAHTLKARHLGIARDQVEERRLDQRQRPHLRRVARGRDQRSKCAVGMCDDVGTSIEQRREIGGVDIEVRLEALQTELADRPVPCPEDWGTVRVAPEAIEFWTEGADRLHDRLSFMASADGWHCSRLAP